MRHAPKVYPSRPVAFYQPSFLFYLLEQSRVCVETVVMNSLTAIMAVISKWFSFTARGSQHQEEVKC